MRAPERRRDGDVETLEFAVHVSPDLRWFRGHFDDNPILPAMVQLREALFIVRDVWPDVGALRRVTKAKFRKPIRPLDPLRLKLRKKRGERKATFRYLRDDGTCSSGTLEFQASSSEGA